MGKLHVLEICHSCCAIALAGSAFAQHRDLDLHNYDDDLMRDLDKTIISETFSETTSEARRPAP
jgi:hypothetical protein